MLATKLPLMLWTTARGATLLPADGRSARQLAAGGRSARDESSTCPTDSAWGTYIVDSEHEWRAHDRACGPQLRLEGGADEAGGGAEK